MEFFFRDYHNSVQNVILINNDLLVFVLKSLFWVGLYLVGIWLKRGELLPCQCKSAVFVKMTSDTEVNILVMYS